MDSKLLWLLEAEGRRSVESASQSGRSRPAQMGRYAKLFIATPMHRTQLCKAGFRGSADL